MIEQSDRVVETLRATYLKSVIIREIPKFPNRQMFHFWREMKFSKTIISD